MRATGHWQLACARPLPVCTPVSRCQVLSACQWAGRPSTGKSPKVPLALALKASVTVVPVSPRRGAVDAEPQ